jgi:Ca2+-binding RTX toxin-like protein
VEKLAGTVFVTHPDGTRSQLQEGDPVFQGDELSTGADGSVGVVLADKTTFSMATNGRMVLDEMVYDPATQSGSVAMSVMQGVFTFVSGSVAKTDPDAMAIQTPVGTIGIRGTQVGLNLSPEGEMSVVLMEERDGLVGEVVVANDHGVQVLNSAYQGTHVNGFMGVPSSIFTWAMGDLLDVFGRSLGFLPTEANPTANDYSDVFHRLGAAGEDHFAAEHVAEEMVVAAKQDDDARDLADFDTAAGGLQPAPSPGLYRSDTSDAFKPFEQEVRIEVAEIPDSGNTFTNDGGGAADDKTGEIATSEPPVTNVSEPEYILVPGTEGADVLRGGAGDDFLDGGAGGDVLYGGDGDDIVEGGAGDDVIVGGSGGGNDDYRGGADQDTVTYQSSTAGVVVDLAAGTATDARPKAADGTGSYIDSDKLSDIENVYGSTADDVIAGDAGANTLVGSLGADTLKGGAGDDVLVGGDTLNLPGFDLKTTTDVVFHLNDDGLDATGTEDIAAIMAARAAADGADVFEGGAGNDRIDGGAGGDTAIFSGNLADYALTVDEASGTVTVTDLVAGRDGTDTLSSIENLRFADGDYTVQQALDILGAVIDGGAGDDSILGGAGNDVIDGGAGNDVIDGGAGDDYIDGGSGADTIDGGTGNDTIVGSTEGDVLTGSDGADTIYGNAGADTIEGGGGDDYIDGGEGADDIDGGAGNDIILGSTENDILKGGDGDDVILADAGDDVIEGGAGNDYIDGGSGADTIDGGAGDDIILGSSEDDVLVGGDGADTILGGAGNDRIEGGAGNDVIDAGEGDDIITGGEGDDAIDGGAGFDTAVYAGSVDDYTVTVDSDTGVVTVTAKDGGAEGTDTLENVETLQFSDGTFTVAEAVDREASAPIVAVSAAAGDEDTAIALDISAALADADGSESLSIVISGVPDGAALSAGTDNGDGTWTLSGADLNELKVTPPADSNQDFQLTVTATATESSGGATASTVATIAVAVAGVADAPSVAAGDVTGAEDAAIALDLSAALADTDGSETLTLTVSGMPEGAVLSAGTDNGDGTWTLTPDQLAGLTLTPAGDFGGSFDLSVTATATEDDGDVATSAATAFTVTVAGVADTPDLAATDASGAEDGAIALNISAALGDADQSETLSVVISGVPDGAALSAGTDNGDGTWTLTAADLSGLTLTPPANSDADFQLSVTATATEGDTTAASTSTFTVDVTGVADTPTLEIGRASDSVSVENLGGTSVAYKNVFGFYRIDENGQPTEGGIIWANAKDHLGETATVDGLDAENVGFFIIPNGFATNEGLTDGMSVSFQQDAAGRWVVVGGDGDVILGDGYANAFFTDPALNPDGKDHEIDSAAAGTMNWEDLRNLGDADYNDVNLNVDFDTTSDADSRGLEDKAIRLDIGAGLTDTDGSESLAIVISDVPPGATLSAGSDNGDGTWTLTASDLDGLTITPPADSNEDFTLTVTAIATENDGDTASVVATLSVDVVGVADVPTVTVTDVTGAEDTAIPLDLTAGLTDVDGSEILSLTVSGVPVGATLSAGTDNGDGSWTLAADQLTGLTITPPTDYSGSFDLSVTATATENDGDTASAAASFTVTVNPVADGPSLAAEDVAGLEDHWIPLDISAAAMGEGEVVSLTLTNLPEGATLNAGTQNPDGSWTLTPTQLDGLAVLPPANSNDDFTLNVVATSTDGSSTASVETTFDVVVTGVADTPTVTVADVTGGEDTAIPLDLSAGLGDLDGSETLSLVIGGLPDGATLSAGTDNGDGTWTLTAEQLGDLTLTPPENYGGSFDLSVTATATENDGDTASVAASFTVTVEGGADAPTLTVTSAAGLEDNAIALDIAATLTDADESLGIVIAGVPEGASLSAGTDNGDGTWTLTADQLGGLTVTPPADSNEDFELTVTATSTDGNGTASTVATLAVAVAGVADMPTVTVTDVSGGVGDTLPLDISAALDDLDGSEVLSVTLGGLPDGSVLSAGTDNGDGTWTLTTDQLEGLMVTPPAGSSADATLSVAVTTTENDGDTATVTRSLDVDLRPEARDDVNVADFGSGRSVGGNVVTGAGDAVDQSGAADAGSGLAVADVTFGDTTKSFANPADVQTDDTGSYIEIDGDAGTLRMYADGNYVYTANEGGETAGETLTAGLTGTGTSAQVQAAWNGVGLHAFNFGTSFTDANGRFDAGLADDTVTFGGRGIGVAGTQDGMPVPDQLNHDSATGQSEALALDLGASASEARLTVSNLFRTESGGEQAMWTAFDADGNKVGEGILNASTIQYGGSSDVGTAVIDAGAAFRFLVITAMPTVNPTAGDSSDLFIRAVSFDTVVTAEEPTEEIFTYTLADVDGDTTTATLTILNDPEADAPTLVVADAAGLEDNAIALDIAAALTDLSETLSVTVSGVPEGATLSAGTDNGDGSWTLTPEQLDGLTVTPPADGNEDFALTVTATSSDGNDTASTTAIINVAVAGVADEPTLDASVGIGVVQEGDSSVTVTNMGSDAGYSNTYGYYLLDDNGHPTEGQIIWSNVKTTVGQSFTLDDVDPDRVGFFLLSDGANQNSGLTNGQHVTFQQNASGAWVAVTDTGTVLKAASGGGMFYSTESLNADRVDHEIDSAAAGSQNWEDLKNGGDFDYNDANFNVTTREEPGETVFALSIDAALTDTDGSETLSVTVAGLPAGAILSAGTDNGDGSWTLAPSDLDGLTLTVPDSVTESFDLTVTATTTENDGDMASTEMVLTVPIVGDDEAAMPLAEAADAAGDEDTAIALDLSAALTDTDGSETLSVTVGGLPEGALLSAGTDNGDGSWTLTPAQLEGLKVTPPRDFAGAMALTLTAIATEANGGDTTTATSAFTVTVNPVDDTPVVEATNASGLEDTPIGLDIGAEVPDSTETVAQVIVSGLPEGATLNAGTRNGDGTWTLRPVDLDGLQVTPPENYSGTFDMHVTAISTDGGRATETLAVTVEAVADAPDLTVADASGEAGEAIPLDISAALNDLDGSETLSVTIAGVPDGAHLSAGTDNGDGSWTLAAGDLGGLTISVPAPEPVEFNLGGSNFNSEQAMIDAWSRTVDGHDISVTAYAKNGNPASLDADVGRGIGVEGLGDSEIDAQGSGSESIVVDFDGMNVASAEVGIRALFIESEGDGHGHGNHMSAEQGHWEAWRGDELVGSGDFEAQAGAQDGRLTLSIEVDGGFDKLRFTAVGNHSDYLLESLKGEAAGEATAPDAFDLTVTATAVEPNGDLATTTATLTVDLGGGEDDRTGLDVVGDVMLGNTCEIDGHHLSQENMIFHEHDRHSGSGSGQVFGDDRNSGSGSGGGHDQHDHGGRSGSGYSITHNGNSGGGHAHHDDNQNQC